MVPAVAPALAGDFVAGRVVLLAVAAAARVRGAALTVNGEGGDYSLDKLCRDGSRFGMIRAAVVEDVPDIRTMIREPMPFS